MIEVCGSVPVGANMDYLFYETRSFPYVNLVRQSNAWANASNVSQPIPNVNPKTGYPTSDFSVVLSTQGVDTGGEYLVYAKGNADIQVLSSYFGYVTDKVYNSTTNSFTAKVRCTECKMTVPNQFC